MLRRMLLATVSWLGVAMPALAAGSPSPTVETILAHPQAVDPFLYAQLVSGLWTAGRRQQAVFWFYMFQARTRPWAQADHGGEGSAAAALRSSLNAELGPVINGWVASDPVAWKTIALRAISYEAHLPLYPGRPDGISAADWQALVHKERVAYADGAREAFATLNPAETAASRRESGLPNGPLEQPGPPLPDDWR